MRIPAGAHGSAIWLVMFFAVLTSSSSAGGNMNCPDCPDWSNFDAWWARYHKNPAAAEPSTPQAARTQAVEARNSSEEVEVERGEYPVASILIRPGDDLEGRVLLDARSPEDYERGHLPGARNLYWRSLRAGDVLDLEVAAGELRRLGVNETDSIVVYGRGDDSAYLFWALDFLGQPGPPPSGREYEPRQNAAGPERHGPVTDPTTLRLVCGCPYGRNVSL